jgi:FAD/FMN-containing dehydrogenase
MSSHAHSHARLKEKKTREPLGHLMLLHALRDAGFKGEVTSAKATLEKYSTDESIFHITPQVVLKPKDEKDVEIAVSVVASETKEFPNLSLTPRAAGTGLGGGSLTDSVVLDVKEHMNDLKVTVSGSKVTLIVEPGAMWRDAEKELKKHDHYLPPYPASKHICTIGGAVANNSAGPDSLRYGHVASWVESLRVVLKDGKAYNIHPLTYKDLRSLLKHDHAHAQIAKEVFDLVVANEKTIERGRPKTTKNTAGYSLWDVISTSVAEFKNGKGVFDLTRLFAGGQGTIGIITSVTMRTEPIQHHKSLIVVPVFNLATASKVVLEAVKHDPINVEIFDALTYDSAMKNPQFFRERLSSINYYRVMLSLYTTYHMRWRRKLPEFVLLITLDHASLKEKEQTPAEVLETLRVRGGPQARLITNPYEREMFWQVRDASFLLSKMLDPKKRPAAFLEDMTVPPEHMAKFFADIKFLLKKYNVTAAIHGHGGNAHFHFYPLLDFTSGSTPALIVKMAEEFFNTAVKYGGNICGEHNDGIIRTPHLSKVFSKQMISIFEQLEHTFDPDDIFNPGKKVHPRFDIKESIRHTN